MNDPLKGGELNAKVLERAAQVAFVRAFRSVAHSVGTPLNVISGRAELELDDASDPNLRKSLQSVLDQCRVIKERIARPLERLGHPQEAAQTMALADLLRDRNAWLAPEHAARVRVEVPEGVMTVPAVDARLVCWSLCNLASALDPSEKPIVLGATRDEQGIVLSTQSAVGAVQLSGPRALGEPWECEGFPPQAWTSALLLHGMAAEGSRRTIVDSSNGKLRLGIVFT